MHFLASLSCISRRDKDASGRSEDKTLELKTAEKWESTAAGVFLYIIAVFR